MRIAIVHDYLREMGGAERVLTILQEMFPQADIITSYIDRDKSFGDMRTEKVRTTFVRRLHLLWKRPGILDRLGWERLARSANAWVFLLPWLFRRIDTRDYDLVISSSAFCSHHVRKRRGQVHVCYCHTPPRFLWQFPDRPELTGTRLAIWRRYIRLVRKMDLAAASKVDSFIANSETVRERIREFYNRDSVVVYPPVDLLDRTRFIPAVACDDGYYLVVSRLDRLKRVEEIVGAFNEIGLPLIVVGTGTIDDRLLEMAGPNITFTGFVTDRELCRYYERAKALVVAAVDEDFGMTAAEAQLFGKPVIAANEGGFRESVIDGETGILFDMTGTSSIIEAIERFAVCTFDAGKIKKNAERFSRRAFVYGFAKELSQLGIHTDLDP